MKNLFLLTLVLSLLGACGDGSNAPRVEDISPATGSLAGGTTISITGSRFDTDPAPSVLIGGELAQTEAVSATQLSVIVPAGERASVPLDVTIANADGTTVVRDAFSYRVAPMIFDVRPPGPLTPGATVTIRGDRFVGEGDEPAELWIGDTAATDVTVVDGTTMTATVPAITGQRLALLDLRIRTNAGEAVLEDKVRVLEPGLLIGENSQRYFDPSNPDSLGNFFNATVFGQEIFGSTATGFASVFSADEGDYEIRAYDYLTQELTQRVETSSFDSRRLTIGISGGQIYAIGRGREAGMSGHDEVSRQMIRFDSAGVESNFGAPITSAGRSCIVARPGGGIFFLNYLTGSEGVTDLSAYDDAGALTSTAYTGDVVDGESCAAAAFFDGNIYIATYQNQQNRLGPETRRLVRVDPSTGAMTFLRELNNREQGMIAIEL